MSFLPWGRNEDNTEGPVTRSEQKRREKAEQELKVEGSPGSETESNSDIFEDTRTTPAIMAPYDQENGTDGEGATKAVFNIKQDCDPKKIKMWFQILENKMQFAQIKAQWTKLQVLTTVLPSHLLTHIEAFAAVPQASAGSTCYYDAKLRLIDIYGEKPHESFEKAIGQVLVTTPSELARRIIYLICDHKQKPLKDCCCAKVVMGIWLRQLSPQVKQAIAPMQLGEGKMEETFRVADAVHRSMKTETQSMTQPVATIATTNKTLPIAALQQARGRGQRHADNPPQSSCRQHWRFGKSAYYCRGTESSPCPWKEYCTTPGNG